MSHQTQRKTSFFVFSYVFLLVFLAACSGTPSAADDVKFPDGVTQFTYKVVHTYPHDTQAFTQGLVFENGILFEGTGRYGQSSVREVDLQTGDVKRIQNLKSQYFGEGITILANRLIQLTWTTNIGFVYDRDSFQQLSTFSYPTEGWGLTHDGKRLILSDGTARIYFYDPETFEQTGFIDVFDGNSPITNLNELEYIDGNIYANVWQTDRIAVISPESGRVTAWIDLTGLLKASERSESGAVLNGIAYDKSNGRLFVTGKLWPKLFEIELVPNS